MLEDVCLSAVQCQGFLCLAVCLRVTFLTHTDNPALLSTHEKSYLSPSSWSRQDEVGRTSSAWLLFVLCRFSVYFPQWLQVIWTTGQKRERNVCVLATDRVSTAEDMEVSELRRPLLGIINQWEKSFQLWALFRVSDSCTCSQHTLLAI